MPSTLDPRRLATLATLVALFVALAVLMVAGAFTRLDQWSIDHLMASVDTSGDAYNAFTWSQFLPFGASAPLWSKVLAAITFPASAVGSGAVVLGCAIVLARRGLRHDGAALFGVWVVANVVEYTTKHELTRQALYATNDAGERIRVASFDNAFPSGHALRALLVAAALGIVWRRGARAVFVWAAVVPPFLVAIGAHTISDVVGGVVLGAAFIVASSLVLHEPLRLRSTR